MSAITGICDLRAICGSASASSCDGTATRTIWQPEAVSSASGMGMPRSIVMTVIASLRDVNGIDKVRHDQDQPEPYQQGENSDTHGEQLAHVHQARIRLAAQPGQPGPGPLVDDDGEVATIQRQQREQGEQVDEKVE